MELTNYIQNDLFECNDVLSMTLSSLVLFFFWMRVKNGIDKLHPNELWVDKFISCLLQSDCLCLKADLKIECTILERLDILFLQLLFYSFRLFI